MLACYISNCHLSFRITSRKYQKSHTLLPISKILYLARQGRIKLTISLLELRLFIHLIIILRRANKMKCVIIVNIQWLIIFSDIGGMLVHSVLKSNQIAQQVISDGAKAKQNGGNLLMTLNLNYKNKTNTVITNIRIAFLSIFVLKSNNNNDLHTKNYLVR